MCYRRRTNGYVHMMTHDRPGKVQHVIHMTSNGKEQYVVYWKYPNKAQDNQHVKCQMNIVQNEREKNPSRVKNIYFQSTYCFGHRVLFPKYILFDRFWYGIIKYTIS